MSLRIIVVVGQYRPLVGGTEVQTARLAREWSARGHDVEIWTRRLDPDSPTLDTEDGVPVRRLGWASSGRFRIRRIEKIHFSLVLFFRLVARKNEYDVVIAQQALYPALVAAIASLVTECPLVVRVASTGATSDLAMWGGATRPVLGLFRHEARALVVMNIQGMNEALADGFLPERVHRIPNGLAISDSAARRDSSGRTRVLYVGGFRTEKRVDLLLQAWALAGSPGELRLAGDGALRDSLKAQARQLGIDVQFLGNVADPRSLLREADIFVLPSDAEGMSNALLEAMAEGCACLATFVGGNVDCLASATDTPPEQGEILRGSAGWLVARGDATALAEGLRLLCADRRARESLGLAARARIESRHSLQRTASAYIDVFNASIKR